MTNRIWTIGSVTLMIVLLIGGWFLGAQPFVAAAAADDAERAGVEQQNIIHQATIAQLTQENDDLASIEAEYLELQKAIPSSTDSSAFIKGLDGLAASANVLISSISVGSPTAYTIPTSGQPVAVEEPVEGETPTPPAAPAPVGSVAVTNPLITPENFVGVQVTISVEGGYDAVLAFLNGLQTGERLFLVTSFSSVRAADEAGSGNVNADIDGLIYVLKQD